MTHSETSSVFCRTCIHCLVHSTISGREFRCGLNRKQVRLRFPACSKHEQSHLSYPATPQGYDAALIDFAEHKKLLQREKEDQERSAYPTSSFLLKKVTHLADTQKWDNKEDRLLFIHATHQAELWSVRVDKNNDRIRNKTQRSPETRQELEARLLGMAEIPDGGW